MSLEHYPHFFTADLDEAHEKLTGMFRRHRTEVLGKKFRYSVHTAQLDLITVNSLYSPTSRDIYQESDGRYCLVSLHHEGYSEHVINGRTFIINPGQGLVRPGETEILTRARGETENIIIRIPTEVLEAEAKLLMGGRSPEIPFEITGTFDYRGRVGRMINDMVRELDILGPDGIESDLTWQRQQLTLVTAIIQHTPNSYQALLQQKFADEPARIVREATQYMAMHLRQHRRIPRLTTALRISARVLEKAFKRCGLPSPKTYWAEMEIDRAYWHIEHPTLSLSVAAVAKAYGFDNEGRFTGVYKERYGRCPREALEEAKRHYRRSLFV